jgi:Mrp family chromosome partitioning ATPase
MASPQDPDVVGPVQAFWRYRLVVLPICVVLAVAAAGAAYATGGTSRARTSIYLTDPRGVPVFRDGSSAPADLATYTLQRAQFARSSDVLTEVATKVPGSETLSSLQDIVTTAGDPSSGITVTCTDASATHAAEICAAVAQVYQEQSKADTDRRAQVSVDALTQARTQLASGGPSGSSAVDALDVKIADTLSTAAQFGSGVEFVENVKTTTDSKVMPAARYGVAAFFFGLLITGAMAWLVAARRPVVSDPHAAALAMGAPLLGEIPPPGRNFDVESLATNLEASGASGLVGVTSVAPSTTKSEAAARLAEVWAHEGHRVLLVEASADAPALSARFGVGVGRPGLNEVLRGAAQPADVGVDVGLEHGASMTYLPPGRPVDHAAGLYRTTLAKSVFEGMHLDYDMVVIDAPPVLDNPNGVALASVADGLVVVVRRGTNRFRLDELKQRLDMLRTPVLGIVFESGRR